MGQKNALEYHRALEASLGGYRGQQCAVLEQKKVTSFSEGSEESLQHPPTPTSQLLRVAASTPGPRMLPPYLSEPGSSGSVL